MRVAVWFALASGPMMMFGWPNHWIVLVAAFAAGAISALRSAPATELRRGGFVHPPSSLNERIGRYTGGDR